MKIYSGILVFGGEEESKFYTARSGNIATPVTRATTTAATTATTTTATRTV